MLIVAPSYLHLGGVAYLSRFPENSRHAGHLGWGGFIPTLLVDLPLEDALALAKTREGLVVEVDTRCKRIWMDVPYLKDEFVEADGSVPLTVTDREDLVVSPRELLAFVGRFHAGTPVESRQHSGVAA